MTPDSPSREESILAEEAEYIHQALFDAPAPRSIIESYVAAHAHYCVSDQQSAAMKTILQRRLDVEAIEFASRRTRTAVTKKVQIVLFLIEARSDYQRFLFKDRSTSPLRSFFALAGVTLRSAYKFIKGKLLIQRHGLV
jgi:hypothetical protein